ncbi:hypothetical protein Taro_056055 [Colocasia esculenta]|uniref:Glucan endo-1,3-beta-D-glucosidase n=1 Tax=Colocasia esculenta TaxID=4460 RepID=A0A843XSX4_COLES|nr:hypothetical protein [Colocasia esculenta]
MTIAHSLAMLETSYPSSVGSFHRDLPPASQLFTFLSKTGAPFLINVYPYFAYKANPRKNMLHAQVHAVHTAIERQRLLGKAKVLELEVRVSKMPSNGYLDEAEAMPENARRYNGNIMRMVAQKAGMPLRPNATLRVYIFALFKNQKPGPTSERNYRLFKSGGTSAYQLVATSPPAANSSASNGGAAGGGDDMFYLVLISLLYKADIGFHEREKNFFFSSYEQFPMLHPPSKS